MYFFLSIVCSASLVYIQLVEWLVTEKKQPTYWRSRVKKYISACTHTINVHTYVLKFTSHYSYSSSLFPSFKKTIFTHSKNRVITFPCARPDRRDVYHLLPVNYLVYLILLFMLSEREECKGQKERVCAVHCFFHLKKSEEY